MSFAMSIRGTVARVAFALLCAHPLAALAQQTSTFEPQGIVAEPDVIQRAVLFADRHISNGDVTNGFYVDSWNMIPGAGWISAGPGYRHWYKKDHVFVNASAAISWNGYKTTQARFELPRLANSRLALGSQFGWQDFKEVDFYGEGPDTLESQLSDHHVRTTDLVGYATFRPHEQVGIGALIGWLKPSRPSNQPTFVAQRSVDDSGHAQLPWPSDTRRARPCCARRLR